MAAVTVAPQSYTGATVSFEPAWLAKGGYFIEILDKDNKIVASFTESGMDECIVAAEP